MKRALLVTFAALAVLFLDPATFPIPSNLIPKAAAATASGALSPSPLNYDFSKGLQNWTGSGTPVTNFSYGQTDADVEDGTGLCKASTSGGSMTGPGVRLGPTLFEEVIESAPFTLPPNGGPLVFRAFAETTLGAGPGLTIRLQHGQDFSDPTVLYTNGAIMEPPAAPGTGISSYCVVFLRLFGGSRPRS